MKLWDFPFDLIFTQLIRTSIMVMVVDVTVELESNISEIFPITLPKKVKALKDAIRDFYCLTGGGLMKNVSGTDLFEVITDEDEQLSKVRYQLSFSSFAINSNFILRRPHIILMTCLCLPMPLIISPIYVCKLTAPAAQVTSSVTGNSPSPFHFTLFPIIMLVFDSLLIR